MKKLRILTFILLLFVGCKDTKGNALKILTETEDSSDRYSFESDVSSERIKELKDQINNWQNLVDQKVEATANIGYYYKLLGGTYFENEMYGPSLEAFQKAINIYPDNSILHFKAAVSSAKIAKSLPSNSSLEYFKLSEEYYKKAIQRNPQYGEALYGLSILYIFELSTPLEAIPLVDKLMSIREYNMEALFLRARLYVITGDIEKAVDIYDQIIKTSKNSDKREQAQQNKKILLEKWNG
ncbi:tetratricopeptide repeat protein [Spirochaeta cellobiosiphila]|uniref:tetratricopeptide repeat protein n=1 Tax=Spirochaeta cellobiosiphila TaxID=504483 RepID=UPI000413C349|nr:tetratricopeptide repeat protein [Spirochaeta cellobiosiphila]